MNSKETKIRKRESWRNKARWIYIKCREMGWESRIRKTGMARQQSFVGSQALGMGRNAGQTHNLKNKGSEATRQGFGSFLSYPLPPWHSRPFVFYSLLPFRAWDSCGDFARFSRYDDDAEDDDGNDDDDATVAGNEKTHGGARGEG